MPERVIFEAGDPEFEDEKPDRAEERIKRGKKLIWVGAATICLALLMVLVFVLLVVGVAPSAQQSGDCPSASQSKIKIAKEDIGVTSEGIPVERYTMTNDHKMAVQVITFGARLTSISVPDSKGNVDDVTLGFDELAGYETTYFGGVIGRVANRIAGANFTLDGETYQLSANDGLNQLHGGIRGWDKYVWRAEVNNDHVIMSRVSVDMEEGFPGEVHANVTYLLTDDNRLSITYSARTFRKPTPINLSSGIFFNLAGKGSSTIYDHSVTIYADYSLEVNREHIPTGSIVPVTGTPFDLRHPGGVMLGSAIMNFTDVTESGYDRAYCLRGPVGQKLAASVLHPNSGRRLTVYTNQPSIQFYTGNHLNFTGKGGHLYSRHSGFVLETQNYPDSIHHPHFPDCVLREGSSYVHEVTLAFTVEK
jgi:aldose 1-epimerase